MDELIVVSEPLKCRFCKSKVNDIIKFGPLYKLGKVNAHYFCVLLSHGLIQNGNDEEGMLGFLLKDIKDKLRKTKTTICTYCGKKNASIICSGRRCPKKFHLPCGLENGSLHQFMKEFKSFCRIHRPNQNIPHKILKDAIQNGTVCCICYESVEVTPRAENVLWAPCCRKTWYHRYCVQKLAHNAGYFFKCAACNDTRKFKANMERFGIYVPQQDASWERVPNAFAELLHRHDTCDAEVCKCPDGRQKDEESTIFEIILCRSCGAQGVHVLCGGLTLNAPEWECDVCRAILTKSRDRKLSPETALEMKECLLKKAGKSSSELVNEAWPPPPKKDSPESIKVETTWTDERGVVEKEKKESRELEVIIEEQEIEEKEVAIKGEVLEENKNIEEEEKKKKEETLEEEMMEERKKEEAEESVIIIKGGRENEEKLTKLAEEQEGEEAEEQEREEAEEQEREEAEEQEREEAEESVIIMKEGRENEEKLTKLSEEQEKEEAKEQEKEEAEEQEGGEEAEEQEREEAEEQEREETEEQEREEAEEQEREKAEESVIIMKDGGENEEKLTKLSEEQEREEAEEQEGEEAEEQEREEAEESVIIIKEGRENEEKLTKLAEEQEREEAEESVIIIMEAGTEEEGWSGEKIKKQENSEEQGKEDALWLNKEKENEEERLAGETEQEKEEEEELGLIVEECEKGEEEEILEDDIMEEQEIDEEREIMQQETREDENWDQVSLVCPTGGFFMSTKSSVVRQTKRQRSFQDFEAEEFQNLFAAKRRKVGTISREFQDEAEVEEEEEEGLVIINVESLSEKWKDVTTQTVEAEEDSHRETKEPEEPKTSKGLDLREVMNAMKPGPYSHKISVLRKALERSSSARHRRECFALFSQFKDIKPGPLCHKLDIFKRMLDGREPLLASHGEQHRDSEPGPCTVAQTAGSRLMSSQERKTAPRRVQTALPRPKMSIIGMEPSDATSSDYREGYQGMTSVVADYEDLSRANLDRLREEHEVELEVRVGSSEGSRTRSRRVSGGLTGGLTGGLNEGEEGRKKDVSTQTELRVKIWLMPTRSLPLWNFKRRQKKDGGGGPS